jgi:hypothetical protein
MLRPYEAFLTKKGNAISQKTGQTLLKIITFKAVAWFLLGLNKGEGRDCEYVFSISKSPGCHPSKSRPCPEAQRQGHNSLSHWIIESLREKELRAFQPIN